MPKRRTEPEVLQWSFSADWELSVTAVVEAATYEEAVAKAKDMDLVDDGYAGASTVNWRVTSDVKKDE